MQVKKNLIALKQRVLKYVPLRYWSLTERQRRCHDLSYAAFRDSIAQDISIFHWTNEVEPKHIDNIKNTFELKKLKDDLKRGLKITPRKPMLVLPEEAELV